MKKYSIIAAMLMGVVAFTSCEDDNDSNPVLKQPETFKFNTPAYASSVCDLANNDSLFFTWKQPDFGYTAAVSYKTQISLDDTWNDATSEEADDATYIELQGSTTSCGANTAVSLIDRAIMKLLKVTTESEVPESSTVYIRMLAELNCGVKCYSNSIKLDVIPYFMSLKDADPQLWYFVGSGAVGNWDNKADDQGNSVIPIALVNGSKYDANTGEGTFSYTGYFAADQFKFVLTPGTWAPMWGLKSEGLNGDTQYRNEGSDPDPACWKPSEAGYYTVGFKTSGGQLEVKVEAVENPDFKEYDNVRLVGSFQGWDTATGVEFTANEFNTHIWYAEYELAEDAECKIIGISGENVTWWGGDKLPYGLTTGANLNLTAGNYRIVFNDIDQCYYFFSK